MITLILFTGLAKQLPTCAHPLLKHLITDLQINYIPVLKNFEHQTSSYWSNSQEPQMRAGQGSVPGFLQNSGTASSFPLHPPPHILSGVKYLIKDSIQFLLQFQLSVGKLEIGCFFFLQIASAGWFPCRLLTCSAQSFWACERLQGWAGSSRAGSPTAPSPSCSWAGKTALSGRCFITTAI